MQNIIDPREEEEMEGEGEDSTSSEEEEEEEEEGTGEEPVDGWIQPNQIYTGKRLTDELFGEDLFCDINWWYDPFIRPFGQLILKHQSRKRKGKKVVKMSDLSLYQEFYNKKLKPALKKAQKNEEWTGSGFGNFVQKLVNRHVYRKGDAKLAQRFVLFRLFILSELKRKEQMQTQENMDWGEKKKKRRKKKVEIFCASKDEFCFKFLNFLETNTLARRGYFNLQTTNMPFFNFQFTEFIKEMNSRTDDNAHSQRCRLLACQFQEQSVMYALINGKTVL